MCENYSFEKIRTIPINLIQLHYFDDVINEFNLIDFEIRRMNCDFIDLKQETINCKGVNLENLFSFSSVYIKLSESRKEKQSKYPAVFI